MILELVNFGPLDVYLQRESQTVKTVDLIEAATSLANAVFHLVSHFFKNKINSKHVFYIQFLKMSPLIRRGRWGNYSPLRTIIKKINLLL